MDSTNAALVRDNAALVRRIAALVWPEEHRVSQATKERRVSQDPNTALVRHIAALVWPERGVSLAGSQMNAALVGPIDAALVGPVHATSVPKQRCALQVVQCALGAECGLA